MDFKKVQQDVFDIVARHLIRQNEQSYDKDTGECYYRGPDGLMCAVGCLIPDEYYESDIELLSPGSCVYKLTDNSLAEVLEQVFCLAKVPFGIMMKFLQDLQGIHDQWDPPNWPERLMALAADHKLSWRIVDDELEAREQSAS